MNTKIPGKGPLRPRMRGQHSSTYVARHRAFEVTKTRFAWASMAVLMMAVMLGASFSFMNQSSASATTVTPIVMTGATGNLTCAEAANQLPGDQNWTEVKFEPISALVPTMGPISGITVSNIEVVGGVMYFDWSSTLVGIDAVIVKQGSEKHNVYVYDPEAFADTDLRPSGLSGGAGGISHISFCWDPDPTSIVTDLHDAAHGSVPVTTSVSYGSTIHDSATVTPASAAGTVTFRFFHNGTCEGTPAATSDALAVLAGFVDAISFAQGPLQPTEGGSYSFRATFTPTSPYLLPSTADCEPFRVKEDPQVAINVDKTADAVYDRQCTWDIDKNVSDDALDLFTGDSATVEYTVDVTLVDCGSEVGHRITGAITISNLSDEDTYEVTHVADLLGGTLDCSLPATLPPGEDLVCNYEILDAAGTETTNLATATVDGEEVEGTEVTLTWEFSGIVIDDSITVDDSVEGDLGSFTGTDSTSYQRTFTCDGDEGTNDNTATFTTDDTGTTGSDDASVTVNCYALSVSKTASTTFHRDWDWTISKTGDQTSLTLSPGQSFLVNYTVVVAATKTDSNWAVSGSIAVNNPAPIAATINSVADLISGFGAASVNCLVTFPYTLPAGGTLNCTYSAALPDGASRTNTATATLQNYSYTATGAATASGTTESSGTAGVAFSTPTTETDECINITDDHYGSLGTVCAPGRTLTYSMYVGPYEACGTHTFVNVAWFVTNDTGATGNDDHTVAVNVPCGVCTLTPGYWKTHSENGPARYDDTWSQIGENTVFFLSGQTYYTVLWTAPQGNPYYILAHAYIAAQLNLANGSSMPADVLAAYNSATSWFAAAGHTPDWAATLKGATRNRVIGWASILDQYNNGLTGPGHCSE